MAQQVNLMFGMPGLSLDCFMLVQLSANAPVRQQMIAQVLEFLLPMWETHMEFVAPCLGLVSAQLVVSI